MGRVRARELHKSIKLFPNPTDSSVAFSCELCGSGELGIDVLYDGKIVGICDCQSSAGCVSGEIKLLEKHLWEVGCGRLYDLVITFGGDTVKSYFGLRDIRLDGFKYLINGKSVFSVLCSTRASTATAYTPRPTRAI